MANHCNRKKGPTQIIALRYGLGSLCMVNHCNRKKGAAQKMRKTWKSGRFSGQLRSDWGNTAWASTVVLDVWLKIDAEHIS